MGGGGVLNLAPYVSFWRGVLRDHFLRRRWMLKFPGKKEEKATSKKSLFKDTMGTWTTISVLYALNFYVPFLVPASGTSHKHAKAGSA